MEQCIDTVSSLTVISLILTALATLGSTLCAWLLINLNKSKSTAETYIKVFDIAQDLDFIDARRYILNKKDDLINKSFADLSDEDKKNIETVSRSYDLIAKILRYTKVGLKDFAKDWRDSIKKTYPLADPLIKEYRKKRSEDFWLDYEKLYHMAVTFPEPKKINFRKVHIE